MTVRMASEESHNAATTDHSVEPKRRIMTPMVIATLKLCTRTSAKMICAEGRKINGKESNQTLRSIQSFSQLSKTKQNKTTYKDAVMLTQKRGCVHPTPACSQDTDFFKVCFETLQGLWPELTNDSSTPNL